jgi:trigger factor
VDANAFDVPKSLVQEEIQRLKQQAVKQFGEDSKIDPSALPDDLFTEQAARRVKIGLIMNEVVISAEIKADDAAVKTYIEDQASVYQDPQQVIDYYSSNAEMLDQVKAVVVENAAVDHILEKSKIVDAVVSYEEAIKSKTSEQG